MEYTAITRAPLMNITKMTEYLTMIEQYAAKRQYILTHPDDLYLEAMNR
jgi:hypothetical protein